MVPSLGLAAKALRNAGCVKYQQQYNAMEIITECITFGTVRLTLIFSIQKAEVLV